MNTRLEQTANTGILWQQSGINFSLCNQMFITSKRSRLRGLKVWQLDSANWGKTTKYIKHFAIYFHISVLKYFSLDKALQKCLPACRRLLFPLGDVCTQATKVSVDGFKSVCCPSYREYSYSKMTEKRQWPKPGVRLTEVSVKTELTVKHRSTFSNSHNKTKSKRVLHTRVFPRCIFPCSYDCFIQSTSHCVLWLVIENITRLKTAL